MEKPPVAQAMEQKSDNSVTQVTTKEITQNSTGYVCFPED
jgi:hypothetical protein